MLLKILVSTVLYYNITIIIILYADFILGRTFIHLDRTFLKVRKKKFRFLLLLAFLYML